MATPGWYGKLPSLGDFASRRLDPEFIDAWDLWLGEGLAAQREQMGEEWLDAYLQSPVWRFVLMPGAMATVIEPLAGVLMPSVDRVGRYFPLTIATPLNRLPRHAADVEALLDWLHRLEDLAVDALQDDWTIEQLEDTLERTPPCLPDVEPAADDRLWGVERALHQAVHRHGGFVAIDQVANRRDLAGVFTKALAEDPSGAPSLPARGVGFWLADSPDAARLLVSHGLPSRDELVLMLGATGREPGETTIF